SLSRGYPHPPKSPLYPYTPLFRSSRVPLGRRRAVHGSGVPTSPSGTASSRTAIRSAPDTPSTMQWCVLLMSATRSPSSPSTTHRSEEHTSELQSRENIVCRILLEK